MLDYIAHNARPRITTTLQVPLPPFGITVCLCPVGAVVIKHDPEFV